MTQPNKTIYVTFQKEGIHKYPAALTDPKLEDVSFLGYPHRHMFHFKVWLEVTHTDRDVEFILFKRELENQYTTGTLQLDYKSCEMMADDLANYINQVYPGRWVAVEVSEDNENGAYCVYPVTTDGKDKEYNYHTDSDPYIAQAKKASPEPSKGDPRKQFMHVRTGNIYSLIGYAKDATDSNFASKIVVVYERNGQMYTKPQSEFFDKFVELSDEAAAEQIARQLTGDSIWTAAAYPHDDLYPQPEPPPADPNSFQHLQNQLAPMFNKIEKVVENATRTVDAASAGIDSLIHRVDERIKGWHWSHDLPRMSDTGTSSTRPITIIVNTKNGTSAFSNFKSAIEHADRYGSYPLTITPQGSETTFYVKNIVQLAESLAKAHQISTLGAVTVSEERQQGE